MCHLFILLGKYRLDLSCESFAGLFSLMWFFDSFLANGDFCRLLLSFANNLEPDHDQQNVGPDLDPNCLTL